MSEQKLSDLTELEALGTEALVPSSRPAAAPLTAPTMDRLAAHGDFAEALQRLDHMDRLQQALTLALIRQTEPGDWVRSKTGQGLISALPTSAATLKMARFLGIDIAGLDTDELVLERVTRGDSNVFGFRLAFRYRSTTANISWREDEVTRWSDEDFTGRQVDGDDRIVKRDGQRSLESDLRSAVRTAAFSKAVKRATGLGKVSDDLLNRAWAGTGRTAAQCQSGHGFGSAQERTGQRVAEGDVAEEAKKVWIELLQATNGDESAARQVMKEGTRYPSGKRKDGSTYAAFAGLTDPGRITRQMDIDKIRKHLASHPIFGGQRERDPGEEG